MFGGAVGGYAWGDKVDGKHGREERSILEEKGGGGRARGGGMFVKDEIWW